MVQISDANKPLISRGTFAREQSNAWKVVLETLNINIGMDGMRRVTLGRLCQKHKIELLTLVVLKNDMPLDIYEDRTLQPIRGVFGSLLYHSFCHNVQTLLIQDGITITHKKVMSESQKQLRKGINGYLFWKKRKKGH